MDRRALLLLILVVVVACGGDDDGAGPPDAAVVACPAERPAVGDPCGAGIAVGDVCAYQACGGDGLIRATCVGATVDTSWALGTTPCDEASCVGDTCGDGEVCAAQVGGALLEGCRAHACGDGPLTCACVCGEDVECEAFPDAPDGEPLFRCRVDCGAEVCA
jgi:hypothetical protein